MNRLHKTNEAMWVGVRDKNNDESNNENKNETNWTSAKAQCVHC